MVLGKSFIKWVKQLDSPINKYRAEDSKEFSGVSVYNPSGKFGFRVTHPREERITLFIDSEFGIKARITPEDRHAYEWRDVSLDELKHLTRKLGLVHELTKKNYDLLKKGLQASKEKQQLRELERIKPQQSRDLEQLRELERILEILKKCEKILDARWKKLPPEFKSR